MLCQKEVLRAVLERRFTYKYFQCFIGASAAALGLKIIEIDTPFEDRRSGHSFLPSMPLGPSSQDSLGDPEVPDRDLDAHTVRPRGCSAKIHMNHEGLTEEASNDRFARAHDINAYYTESGFLIRQIELRRLATIRRLVEPTSRDRLLEVGCGGGHVLRLFPEARLTGVDVSGEMLKRASANLRGLSVQLLKGELQELNLQAGSFDKIVCTEVLSICFQVLT